MQNLKKQFIYQELWALTIAGGFQRANVYIKGVDEKHKGIFKDKLHELIINISEEYNKEIDDVLHLKNINTISKNSLQFKELLQGGKLKFGVCQKLLNLYLKYLWCLGENISPPHFPVDRRIQEKLKISKIANWTEMSGKVGETEYMNIINVAREVNLSLNYKSISELELYLFNRKGY